MDSVEKRITVRTGINPGRETSHRQFALSVYFEEKAFVERIVSASIVVIPAGQRLKKYTVANTPVPVTSSSLVKVT